MNKESGSLSVRVVDDDETGLEFMQHNFKKRAISHILHRIRE